MLHQPVIGTPRDRVDGRAKVTGAAPYVADFAARSPILHAHMLGSPIARGRIRAIRTEAAEAVPGVVAVFTHENRPSAAFRGSAYQDQVAPPGQPLRPLHDDRILHSGQPIALVVAETYEAARFAANLIEVSVAEEPCHTDLAARLDAARHPSKRRSGIQPPPSPKGDAAAALDAAPVRVQGRYIHGAEHHNAMEPHATTVIVEEGGRLLIHDKIQGVTNTQEYVCSVFGLKKDDVRVVTPFLGGGFGSGLRPHHQCFLAVMAALALGRSVTLVLSRDQQWSIGHRPETVLDVALGAKPDGTLLAIRQEAIAATSSYEEYQETVVNWVNLLYPAPHVLLDHRLVHLDIETPLDMRAPGAPTGLFAAESAMDELAEKLGMDPLALRIRNHADTDESSGKRHTSKELLAAYQLAAARFGWAGRPLAPRAMRQGRELVGWGMATGAWEAQMQKHQARVLLEADGSATVGVATGDLGTGTYTILAQIAAEELGLPMERVTVLLGDSSLPYAPVSGGSWTAASAGSAVADACARLKAELLRLAQAQGEMLGASLEDIRFAGGRMARWSDAGRALPLGGVLRAAGRDRLVADGKAGPDQLTQLRHSSHAHAAAFAEVRVDEELGQVRVTRVVQAVAAGRILNPKTARSQVIGGTVWGIGMALHEESQADHRLGRWMNHNLAEYHVPANADVEGIEVIFVEERDRLTSPIGVKGLGEIGICGTPAAIGNAIWHATGRRMRELPMTVERVLGLKAPRA